MSRLRSIICVCAWMMFLADNALAAEPSLQATGSATLGKSKQEKSPSTSPVTSTESDSPSAVYQRGISFRNEGKYEEAAAHYFAAAQKGSHLAEVELAYLHSELGSPMWDDPAAFAWFTLAIKHEPKPELAKILARDREVVRLRMSSAEQTEARRLSGTLLNNLGAVPAFVEAK